MKDGQFSSINLELLIKYPLLEWFLSCGTIITLIRLVHLVLWPDFLNSKQRALLGACHGAARRGQQATACLLSCYPASWWWDIQSRQLNSLSEWAPQEAFTSHPQGLAQAIAAQFALLLPSIIVWVQLLPLQSIFQVILKFKKIFHPSQSSFD